jgi:CheY-like chemotaxis protein
MDGAPEILFVDDNPADCELVEEAFRQYEVAARFTKIDSGPKALADLRGRAAAGRSLPELVLLDVNLPVMDGHEVLRQIRSDASLGELQVVMLSSSDRRRDIERSEQLHATSYVIKPSNWDEYLVLVRSFEQRLKRKEAHALHVPAEAPGDEPSPLTPPSTLPGLD